MPLDLTAIGIGTLIGKSLGKLQVDGSKDHIPLLAGEHDREDLW